MPSTLPSESLTAAQIVSAVQRGELTARQATEQALERIEARDGRIGAFQEVRVFRSLEEADRIDARDDKAVLPLAGLPVAIKDNVPVQGEPMRQGSAGSDPAPQSRDHEIVRRLREAGAVVVGITRVPELCVFGATDSTFGVTHNPWDLSRTPGGSSGGSAAAVAAGMVPIAHGNDGMGSIRIPSACCGLVGIKPGLGVVPADLGEGSWFSMSENGPLATTVEDCALMLSVLAGRRELATVNEAPRVRIGVSTKVFVPGVPVDKHWVGGVHESADLLRDAGHTVVRANPPYGQRTSPSALVRWMAGTALETRLLADPTKLEPRIRRHAAIGRAALRLGLPREKGRTRWQRAAEGFFSAHDVLLTPTLAQPPIAARAWGRRGWSANMVANVRYAPFCAPWNLAGWPAIAVPAGLHPNGTPLSVQLVARPGGEALLLSLAAELEQLRPWARTAPTP